MHLEGEQQFDAPVARVWDVSFQPEVLEDCIPGAQSVERTSETTFEGTVERGLASVTIAMELSFEITEDERPDRVVASFEGSDNRTNSTADGDLEIALEATDDGEGALLAYEADIHFSGRLASLGGMLIKRQLNKDLRQFFENLEEYVSETELEA
jgi:hypothetical protein